MFGIGCGFICVGGFGVGEGSEGVELVFWAWACIGASGIGGEFVYIFLGCIMRDM